MLANLFAKICLLQMIGKRHWLLENPRGSDLFKLASWKELEPFAHKAKFHQCLLGLIDQNGEPIKKATEVWASTWVLIYRLHGLICDEKHQIAEGTVRGQDRCDYAKVWPRRLCEIVVAGIEELRRMPKLAYAITSNFSPVQSKEEDTNRSHFGSDPSGPNHAVGSKTMCLPSLLPHKI